MDVSNRKIPRKFYKLEAHNDAHSDTHQTSASVHISSIQSIVKTQVKRHINRCISDHTILCAVASLCALRSVHLCVCVDDDMCGVFTCVSVCLFLGMCCCVLVCVFPCR